MTINQFAKTHGVSRTQVHKWIEQKRIKYLKSSAGKRTNYWILSKDRPEPKPEGGKRKSDSP